MHHISLAGAFHLAASNGHADVIALLSEHGGLDVNERWTDGVCALHRAAWGTTAQHRAAARALVAAGADPTCEGKGTGETAADASTTDETQDYLEEEERRWGMLTYAEKAAKTKVKTPTVAPFIAKLKVGGSGGSNAGQSTDEVSSNDAQPVAEKDEPPLVTITERAEL